MAAPFNLPHTAQIGQALFADPSDHCGSTPTVCSSFWLAWSMRI